MSRTLWLILIMFWCERGAAEAAGTVGARDGAVGAGEAIDASDSAAANGAVRFARSTSPESTESAGTKPSAPERAGSDRCGCSNRADDGLWDVVVTVHE